MWFLDIFKIKKFKKELKELNSEVTNLEKENTELKNIKYDIDQLEYKDLKLQINQLLKEKEDTINTFNLEKSKKELEIEEKNNIIIDLNNKINALNNKIINLEEEELMQSFGFYNPKYNLENSEQYKEQLDFIRQKQKQMVKDKTAVTYIDWKVNNSTSEGRKMTNDMIKLTLRAFNLETDNVILKVKFNNIQASEKRLNSSFDTINKLGKVTKVKITNQYLQLKFQELYLAFEYEKKKQEEKEEQLRIKEEMREKAKVEKELEVAKRKIEKEETHFNNAISDIKTKLEKASDKEKESLLKKLEELECKIKEIKETKKDIENREQNTRAGYVYIISNIGSFGENVYKIGMTRRLEPMDRVSELSSASVPFPFDVHAMIFSEDAPTLENTLHKEFDNRRVNKINQRKEFFEVSLSEIEKIVKEKHNKVVEFTKLAQAEEYRRSLAINESKCS